MSRHEYPVEVVMIGGFKCKMTTSERNEWKEFVEQTEPRKELEELNIKFRSVELRVIARTITTEEIEKETTAYHKRKNELTDQLYIIAKQWYADLMKRIKEEESAKATAPNVD